MSTVNRAFPPLGAIVGLWWYGRPRTATVRKHGRSRVTVEFLRNEWSAVPTIVTVPFKDHMPATVPRQTPAFAYSLTLMSTPTSQEIAA